MKSCEAQELQSGAELKALRPEWEDLWNQCPNASPFQHPLWLISWWNQFGIDKQLMTVSFRENEKLTGVVPLCILRNGCERKMMPVGIGLSDYLDALFAPNFAERGARKTFAYLLENSRHWDQCEFQPLLGGSPLLNAVLPTGTENTIETVDTLTSIELPSRQAGFRRLLSRHFIERLKEAGKRAAKFGEVRFEMATGTALDETMSHLLKFHRARWGNTSSSAEEFYRQTSAELFGQGDLRLYTLRIGGRIASVLYGFVQRRRGYLYLTGFDPEFEKASPGLLILTHAIESLIKEGARTCEFLRGREAYKYRWGIIEQPTYVRKLQSHSTLGS